MKYCKCGAWQLSALPIGLAAFGQRFSGWKPRRLISRHFEDLSAAVQDSRVSSGFVNGYVLIDPWHYRSSLAKDVIPLRTQKSRPPPFTSRFTVTPTLRRYDDGR